ncbi:hypothetical protein ACK9YZ_12200 [Rhizobium sp. ZK1]|uniref:hypothetical protein n=1 Tax=Rhizobium sp. ZK1 TaxID=3389872 RepID=UPI0039F65520
MSLIALIIATILHFAQPSASPQAEVFGLHEGQTRTSLGLTANAMGSQRYRLASVPKPDPDFTGYLVTVGEKTGLCSVTAVAPRTVDDAGGVAVRKQMDAVVRRLEAIYGSPAKVDTLHANAQWTRPADWVMALHEEQRDYEFRWPARAGVRAPVAGITSVTLSVGALEPDSAVMFLQINFDNLARCQAESAGSRNSK